MFTRRLILKIIIFVLLGAALVITLITFSVNGPPLLSFDQKNIPKLITANVMDIDRIYMISKFRSGAGHDYSDSEESCRSMKHYVNTSHVETSAHTPLRSLPTPTEPNIKIYAPFDGTIESVSEEHTPIGKQVRVSSREYPQYRVRLFHIDLLPQFGLGSKIASGEWIGTVGPKDGTDVAVETWALPDSHINLSMFQAMTDDAFSPYAKLGYHREDFVISKEYRDAHPLQCESQNEQFVRDMRTYDWQQDFVMLRPDPYAREVK